MKLSFENISKLYGDTVALQQIDLTLGSGVYGLLGPNGAGKTTLMRIMTDLLAPSTGRVLLDGQDIAVMGAAFRKKLGYLPQDFGVYPNFTAEQFEQVMSFDEDTAMQKKWKAFVRKIYAKTEDYNIVIETINHFLADPFKAAIEGTNFTAKWTASENEWK